MARVSGLLFESNSGPIYCLARVTEWQACGSLYHPQNNRPKSVGQARPVLAYSSDERTPQVERDR
jgi:hypothetical protein